MPMTPQAEARELLRDALRQTAIFSPSKLARKAADRALDDLNEARIWAVCRRPKAAHTSCDCSTSGTTSEPMEASMALRDFNELNDWLSRRQPLIRECETWIKAALVDEPMGDFRTIGSEHHREKNWIKPRFGGIPEGQQTLVELAARTTQNRSRRWIGHMLKPLPNCWDSIVRETFEYLPFLEVGRGWSDLIIAMSIMIAETNPPRDFKISDVKQKYGELRVYHSGNDPIERITDAAEALSAFMCESCGAPGKQRGRGWITTLCDGHANGDE